MVTGFSYQVSSGSGTGANTVAPREASFEERAGEGLIYLNASLNEERTLLSTLLILVKDLDASLFGPVPENEGLAKTAEYPPDRKGVSYKLLRFIREAQEVNEANQMLTRRIEDKLRDLIRKLITEESQKRYS